MSQRHPDNDGEDSDLLGSDQGEAFPTHGARSIKPCPVCLTIGQIYSCRITRTEGRELLIETEINPIKYAESLRQKMKKNGRGELTQMEKQASRSQERKQEKTTIGEVIANIQQHGENRTSRGKSQGKRRETSEVELNTWEYVHMQRENGNERLEVGPLTIKTTDRDRIT